MNPSDPVRGVLEEGPSEGFKRKCHLASRLPWQKVPFRKKPAVLRTPWTAGEVPQGEARAQREGGTGPVTHWTSWVAGGLNSFCSKKHEVDPTYERWPT